MFRDRDGWRVQWTESGRRRSKKFESKGAARVFEAQLRHGELQNPSGASETFREFSERWLERYCKVEKAESQWVTDESTIRIHLLPALGELRLSSLRPAQLKEFRLSLREKLHPKTGKALKPKTLNNVIGTLKKMLATAVEWELLPQSPAAGLKFFEMDDQDFDYWTPEERDKFWRAARREDEAFADLCLFAAHTGLRRGEIAGLLRHQLNFEARTILVNASYCFKTEQRRVRVKTKRRATVPMNAEVIRLLRDRQLLPPEAQVFSRELLRHAAVRLRRLAVKVGARPIRFHDLRHTFGSSLAMAGVESYTRQMLMRHRTPLMTQRYSHLAPSHLQEGAEALCRARTAARGDMEEVVTSENQRMNLEPLTGFESVKSAFARVV